MAIGVSKEGASPPVQHRYIGGEMPAVGGGPSSEQWRRMSTPEKVVYLVLVGAAVLFIGYLLARKLLG